MCDIVLAGVGGQGLLVLSTIIGNACCAVGEKVITAEQHGLAQRSGSVHVHIRIGEKYSPQIPYGMADFLISLEAMEALRRIEYVKDEAIIVMNKRVLHPVVETDWFLKSQKREYITVDTVVEQVKQVTPHIFLIDGAGLAGKAGYTRTENVVLLGAACGLPGFPLDKERVEKTLLTVVPPKWVDVNMKAFELGYQEVLHFF